jgi:kinesin family protein 2/24
MAFGKQEMKLLTEVDQPGSQINRYVSQLSKLLSKKAQGLMDLQARVARFQQLMQEGESLGPHQPG